MGNNPVIFNDPNGEDIIIRVSWVYAGANSYGTLYKPVINVIVTGSVINLSNSSWNAEEVADKANDLGNYYLSGNSFTAENLSTLAGLRISASGTIPDGGIPTYSLGVDVKFNFQLKGIEDLSQASEDDHLFIIGTWKEAGFNATFGKEIHPISRAVTLINGGRTALLDGTNTKTNRQMGKLILHEFWVHMAKAQHFHLESAGELTNGDVLKNSLWNGGAVEEGEMAVFFNAFYDGRTNLYAAFHRTKNIAGEDQYVIPRLLSTVQKQISGRWEVSIAKYQGRDASIFDAGLSSLRGIRLSDSAAFDTIYRRPRP